MKKKPKIRIKSKIKIKPRNQNSTSDPNAKKIVSLKNFKDQILKSSQYKYISLFTFFVFLIFLVIILKFSTCFEEVNPPEPTHGEPINSLTIEDLINGKMDHSLFSKKTTIQDKNTDLATLLKKDKVPMKVLNELIFLAKQEGIDSIYAQRALITFESKKTTPRQKFYIYKLDYNKDIFIGIFPKPKIKIFTKTVTTKIKSVAGIVDSTLLDAVLKYQGDLGIINKLEEALKWTIDLYHVKTNDRFKLIYEELWVDDKAVDVGKLLAVYFKTNNKEYFAFNFENEDQNGFFDQYGNSMKKRFLQSPVKYNRITSGYDPKRIHPVLGKERPHLGTDYYAKKGDPIFAVGDGIVIEARFKKNNGNYIKIKHDNVYKTQYLHIMDDGFAEGIKKGAMVNQGQVIGYAGKTGLATGYHVCFRFWKNGMQVNHLKEDIVQNETSFSIDDIAFFQIRDSLQEKLEVIQIDYF